MKSIEQYLEWYENQLLYDVLPFWIKHSVDNDHGGYLTCLTRQGDVYDTDKFIWLQARQVWTFAKLYNDYKNEARWLELALHGAHFLEKYGRDESGDWYFSLTRNGEPLVVPYNIFSDCFACMAFGQLYLSTQEERFREICLTTFHNIRKRQNNPKGRYSKDINDTRPLKGFSLPMIMANLCLEIEPILEPDILQQTLQSCEDIILNQFYREELGLIVEAIGVDGNLIDTMDGRLVNPGHAIEACWFLMDIGVREQDQSLIHKAVHISLQMLEYGWDKEYGGIFYFLDRKGYPMQQLEWDQKLWWVHLETLVAMSKGYLLTGNAKCLEWFHIIHEYSWSRFHDPECGEWFGYLKRDGTLLNSSKGGKWKGCFHVPRALWQCVRGFQEKETEN